MAVTVTHLIDSRMMTGSGEEKGKVKKGKPKKGG